MILQEGTFIILNDSINFNEPNTCQIIHVISMHVHLVQLKVSYLYFTQEKFKKPIGHTPIWYIDI